MDIFLAAEEADKAAAAAGKALGYSQGNGETSTPQDELVEAAPAELEERLRRRRST